MRLAKDATGTRIEATPRANAICPSCGASVRAKCGTVNVWHWAHESADCDPWAEPETGWHAWWKSAFDPGCQEVVRGCHRADIVTPSGIVLEVQHSTISAEDIQERERYYGRRMMWILDMREQRDNLDVRTRDGFATFRWKHPRRSFWASSRMVALDLGGRIFVVKKLHTDTPCGGWGKSMTLEAFLVALGGYGCNAWDVQMAWSRLDALESKRFYAVRVDERRRLDTEAQQARASALATQDGGCC